MTDPADKDAEIAALRAEVARVTSESKRFAEDVAVQVAALMATTAQLKPWSIALQDLTPGGSEFQTPEACLAYARDVRDRQIETIKTFMREKRAAKARVKELEAGLREAVYAVTSLSPCESDGSHRCRFPGDTLAYLRALLSPKDKTNG